MDATELLRQKLYELHGIISVRRDFVLQSLEKSDGETAKLFATAIANEQAAIMDMIADILEPNIIDEFLNKKLEDYFDKTNRL